MQDARKFESLEEKRTSKLCRYKVSARVRVVLGLALGCRRIEEGKGMEERSSAREKEGRGGERRVALPCRRGLEARAKS